MADNLPQELCKEILLRLPVKTLLQCTCVCKSWNSIIINSNFITSHLNRTTLSNNNNNNNNNNATDLVLFRRYSDDDDEKERYILCRDIQTLDESPDLEFPFQSQNPYFRIVGSCNGLLCLSDDYFVDAHTIILYNPSIRKSLTLPKPCITLNRRGMFVLGFGFDANTSDYKIVRLVYQGKRHANKAPPNFDPYLLPKVELYSLRLGSWRRINSASAPKCYVPEFWWSQAFLNGVVHWLASYRYGMNPCLILSFDLGNEVFHNIELPASLVCESVMEMSITVFGESLSVFHDRGEDFSIWVLKEYGVAKSWSKLFTIDLQIGLDMVVGLTKNGEILAAKNGELVSYHPERRRIQHLSIYGDEHSFYVDTYMESLVLLDEVNEVLRKGAEPCEVVTHKKAPVMIGDEESRNSELRKKSKKRESRLCMECKVNNEEAGKDEMWVKKWKWRVLNLLCFQSSTFLRMVHVMDRDMIYSFFLTQKREVFNSFDIFTLGAFVTLLEHL